MAGKAGLKNILISPNTRYPSLRNVQAMREIGIEYTNNGLVIIFYLKNIIFAFAIFRGVLSGIESFKALLEEIIAGAQS
jgi:hypothetical protein